MALMRIYKYGSPILSRPAARVTDLPGDFDQIIEDMFDTMYDDDGIGLSANQVGLDMCFFIVDFSLHDDKMSKMVFINPEITEASGQEIAEEGCLSVPGIRENVPRAQKVTVRYKTPEGDERVETYEDFTARVIQHETDHLNGVFFVDRISPLKRSFITSKLKRMAQESLEEAGNF